MNCRVGTPSSIALCGNNLTRPPYGTKLAYQLIPFLMYSVLFCDSLSPVKSLNKQKPKGQQSTNERMEFTALKKEN